MIIPKATTPPKPFLRVGDARMKAEKYAEAQEKYTQLLTDFPKSAISRPKPGSNGAARFSILTNRRMRPLDFQSVADDKTAGSYQPEASILGGCRP